MSRFLSFDSLGRVFSRFLAAAVALAICSAMLLASACVSSDKAIDTTAVPAAIVPAAWDLGTPTSTVDSYLRWVTYSYRMINSDVCSATMTPEEWVRVDAYIQLNAQKPRGLDQHLVKSAVRSSSVDGTGAIVALSEDWRYRYFVPSSLRYEGPEHSVSYETTYTLVNTGGVWLIASVEASASSDVP